jgi:hypothetical protein
MSLYVLLPLWLRKPNPVKHIIAAIIEEIKALKNAIVRGICRLFNMPVPVWAAEPQVDEARNLRGQVLSTYSNLRYGLAIIGFVLPPFLVVIGKYWYGIAWKESMSAYYWAGSDVEGPWRSWLTDRSFFKVLLDVLAGLDGDTPMRSWFVGILFVLGIFLYLYKGFSTSENYLLNGAGLSALGVALFPMCNPETTCSAFLFRGFSLHGLFAIVSFVCIAWVALTCANDTLKKLPLEDQAKSDAYGWWYKRLGWGMIILTVGAFIVTTVLGDPKLIFYVEALNMWAFALYWLIKSNELSEKRASQPSQAKQPAVAEERAVTDESAVTEEVSVAEELALQEDPRLTSK